MLFNIKIDLQSFPKPHILYPIPFPQKSKNGISAKRVKTFIVMLNLQLPMALTYD